ncbi:MAG: type I glyceraldehyde-3-phosphate dehydrogenase [Epsilonproteobacteria bacterium]|nr:type I glyceraldehyde-3-phosphate dehydrogenase [Campylobacterota bacterium]
MSRKKVRIFINGFGRIGRSAARIILDDDNLELVGINDLYSYQQMVYLLKYDSIYHPLKQSIRLEHNILFVDHQEVRLFNNIEPKELDIEGLDIDIVLECTGMFLTMETNKTFIEKGAQKVIISSPPIDQMPTYMFGVNHEEYKQEAIISNSSCSANAIVPILKIIDRYFGIESAGISMYHSYTSYQNLLDNSHYSQDIRRTRSATQNIIPLISTAAEATSYFLPHLKGKLAAKSIRVPIPSTTFYDMSIEIFKSSTKEEVCERLAEEISLAKERILDTTSRIEASDQYIQCPYSAVLILPLISVVQEGMLRVCAWQDNEFGYAKRLVDMAKAIA